MGKADDLRAAREAAFKSSRGSLDSRQGTPQPVRPTALRAQATGSPEVAPGPREAPKPKGRPLDKDRAKSFEVTKPWLAEGMSRRTWYRRKAKGETNV